MQKQVKIVFIGYYLREHNLFLISKDDGYSILKGGIYETSSKNELFGTQKTSAKLLSNLILVNRKKKTA